MAQGAGSDSVKKRTPKREKIGQQGLCLLDGIGLSISVQLSAAPGLKRNRFPNSTL